MSLLALDLAPSTLQVADAGDEWARETDAIITLVNSSSIGMSLFGGSISGIVAKLVEDKCELLLKEWREDKLTVVTPSVVTKQVQTMILECKNVKGIDLLKPCRKVDIPYRGKPLRKKKQKLKAWATRWRKGCAHS